VEVVFPELPGVALTKIDAPLSGSVYLILESGNVEEVVAALVTIM